LTNWNDIIKQCADGEKNAQEELYRRCYVPMIKVCNRYARDMDEAGTIYNEAMLKVFNNLHQYKNKGDFEAWVQRIVVNTCIDCIRKQARFIHQSIDSVSETSQIINPDVYERFSGNDIIRLIQQLPRNTALVFNLFVLEGYKHEEIGKIAGISTGTSKWHMNEARRLLKEQLDQLLKKEIYLNVI
jgi:RNA polymerase sigma-70 factor (ECF subfamily)